MTDDDYRAVHRDAQRKMAQWISLDDLANKMLARAAQGKRVILTPGTAEAVARALQGRWSTKNNRR